MNALVTGATGFIGSHLVERLLGEGARVRALVRPERDASALEAAGVEVRRGDLCDPAAVRHAMHEGQIVFHLAKARRGSPAGTLRAVNLEGTANVARAAAEAGVARLVHAGTAAVYGGIVCGAPAREDAALRPDSAYARSKAQSEHFLRSCPERDSLPVVVARISSVLGPRAEGFRGLFAAIEAGRFRMIGTGGYRHHLADVSDIVEGLLRCATVPGVEGRTYNLAGSEPIPLRDLVQLIARELGRGGTPKSLPAAPLAIYRRLSERLSRIIGMGLPRADGIATLMSDRVLDISRARLELGYAPQVSVQQAVRRTAEWYRGASSAPTRSAPAGAAASAPR